MAIGASKTENMTSGVNGQFYVTISWTETGTSVANNTSTISLTGTLGRVRSGDSFWVTGAGNLKIYWHDNKSNADTLVNTLDIEEIGYNNASRSVTGSVTPSHKDDGTLAGYAKAVWTRTSDYGGYAPVSKTAQTSQESLTTIARASAPTMSASSITIPASSGTITVNTNRASSSFTHTITLKVGNTTIATYTGVGASKAINIADIDDAILATIPSATSATVSVSCQTFSGSTSVGTKSTSFTAKVGSGAKPTFSNFTFADTNSTTTAITGNNQVMISGKSSISATISAANRAVANYSASITKYTFSIAGLSAEQAYSTSQIVKALGSPTVGNSELPSGRRDLVITAIDSRGLSTSVTKSVTIVPYQAPIVNASASRANGFESTTTIKISGSFSRIEVGGTAKNTVNTSTGVAYRYKSQSTTTWGSWTNRTATVNTSTGTITTSNFTLELDNQTAYDFQFRIIDSLQTTTASIVVAVGQPAFWIGADGRVGIGGMPGYAKGSSDTGLLHTRGKIYASTNLYAGQDAIITRDVTMRNFTTQDGGSREVYQTLHAGGATDIGANVDLNTKAYLKVGRYLCGSAVNGSTITNNPCKGAFFMEVRNILKGDHSASELDGTWVYHLRTLYALGGEIWTQYCSIGGTAGSVTYGPWQRLRADKVGTKPSYETNSSSFSIADRNNTTINLTTNDGMPFQILRTNNGAANILKTSGSNYIQHVRVMQTTIIGSTVTNGYGIWGLKSGSTIYSYWSGTKNGANENNYSQTTTEGQTSSYYYGTAINAGGNKSATTFIYDIIRSDSAGGWNMIGQLQSKSSGNALSFEIELTAPDNFVVPMLFQRGASSPTRQILQIEII